MRSVFTGFRFSPGVIAFGRRRLRLRHREVHRVLAVVVRVAVRVVPLRHQDVRHVRGLAVARNRRRRAVGRRRRTACSGCRRRIASAASIAAITRSVSAPFVLRNACTAFGTTSPGPQDIALNRVVDLASRAPDPARPARRSRSSDRNARRCGPSDRGCRTAATETRDPCASSSMICSGRCPSAAPKHQHLIRVRVVDAGLARGHAFSGHDHGLNAHQKLDRRGRRTSPTR